MISRWLLAGRAGLHVLGVGVPYGQFEAHLYDVTEIFPLHMIVRFYEDLSQDGLADRVVLGVEFVKTMESVPVLKRKKTQQEGSLKH